MRTAEPTKKQVMNSNSNISNQTALVKRMIKGPKNIKTFQIPDGRGMMEYLGPRELTKAMSVWLRGCRNFLEAEVSFAKDPKSFDTDWEQVQVFNAETEVPQWEMTGQGIHQLSEDIVGHIAGMDNVPVAIKVTKEGIFIKPQPEDVEFGPPTTEELQEERERLEGQEEVTYTGTDWVPWVRFVLDLSKRDQWV